MSAVGGGRDRGVCGAIPRSPLPSSPLPGSLRAKPHRLLPEENSKGVRSSNTLIRPEFLKQNEAKDVFILQHVTEWLAFQDMT